jgi:hypothetical protein
MCFGFLLINFSKSCVWKKGSSFLQCITSYARYILLPVQVFRMSVRKFNFNSTVLRNCWTHQHVPSVLSEIIFYRCLQNGLMCVWVDVSNWNIYPELILLVWVQALTERSLASRLFRIRKQYYQWRNCHAIMDHVISCFCGLITKVLYLSKKIQYDSYIHFHQTLFRNDTHLYLLRRCKNAWSYTCASLYSFVECTGTPVPFTLPKCFVTYITMRNKNTLVQYEKHTCMYGVIVLCDTYRSRLVCSVNVAYSAEPPHAGEGRGIVVRKRQTVVVT